MFFYLGKNYGKTKENFRIMGILKDRVADLRACGKDDTCWELADIIEVCIDDMNDKEYGK